MWGGVGACPGRHSLDLTPLGLLPASQHFSSCPVKAAGEAILISRLNILITSDVISFICLDGEGGGGSAGRVVSSGRNSRGGLFFSLKWWTAAKMGPETVAEKHLGALNILCRGLG